MLGKTVNEDTREEHKDGFHGNLPLLVSQYTRKLSEACDHDHAGRVIEWPDTRMLRMVPAHY